MKVLGKVIVVMKEFIRKYKHAWVFLYGLIYFPWFFWLEQRHVSGYHLIYASLDRKIPFCEYFIIPYLLCLFGQKRVSTTTSGILLSFESVFATAMSILVLHERISLQFMAGGALVIGAAVLSEWSFEGKGNSKGKNKKEKGDDNGKGINETE